MENFFVINTAVCRVHLRGCPKSTNLSHLQPPEPIDHRQQLERSRGRHVSPRLELASDIDTTLAQLLGPRFCGEIWGGVLLYELQGVDGESSLSILDELLECGNVDIGFVLVAVETEDDLVGAPGDGLLVTESAGGDGEDTGRDTTISGGNRGGVGVLLGDGVGARGPVVWEVGFHADHGRRGGEVVAAATDDDDGADAVLGE